MPDPPPDPTDRAFGDYVAACADALARGDATPSPPPAASPGRCAKARSALRLLARVRHSDAALPDTLPGDCPSGNTEFASPVGRRIGRYELGRELGRGGMGVVYLARDTDLDRAVAVKVISGGGPDRDSRLARFRVEGRLLARLEHPNVVRVYEAGDDGGQPYLAMEYVGGPSLHRHLGGRPLPPREAAALVEAVARAVEYAHRQGVIHRDLKPANILLEKDEGGRMKDEGETKTWTPGRDSSFILPPSALTPKVTDFGLATAAGGESDLTRTGELIGTPGYLAPEAVSGVAEPGPAVDVYGLGAVLYECLTGRPPFVGANLAVTLMLVQHADPPPPRQLNPDVPRDLETVCLACLRKEPGRRYKTAAAAADDLAAVLAGRPIQARPVGRVEAALKWARRNRAVAALSAAIVVALLAGSIGSGYFAVEAGARAQRETSAASAAKIAQADAVAAKAASDLLAARLRFRDAIHRAEDGDVEAGLLGMADALRLAPADAADFRRAVRLSFAAWGRQLPVLRFAVRPWDAPPRFPWVHPIGPSGLLFAAWADGRPLTLLDAATGRPARETVALAEREAPIALSADGFLLLTRTDGEPNEPTMRLRRLPGGEPVGPAVRVPYLPGKQGGPNVGSVVLSEFAVMTSGMNTAPWWGPRRFWDATAGTQHPLVVSERDLIAVRPVRTADGREAAVVVRGSEPREGADWRAEFYDVTTGARLDVAARLHDRSDPRVHAGGRVVLTVFGDEVQCPDGADGSVAWWEVGTGRLLERWRPGREARVSCLTSDGQTLVAYGTDARARLFDLDTGLQRGGDVPLHDGAASEAAGGAFPGNPALLTLDPGGVLRGWETRHLERQVTAAARPRTRPPAPGRTAAPFTDAAFSPSGRVVLLSAGHRGEYGRLVETATGRPIGPPLRQPHRRLIAFTPDERVLVTAPYNYAFGGTTEVHFTDPATGAARAAPVPLPTYPHGLAVSPDGRTLAVARLNATTLIDLPAGTVTHQLAEKTCIGAVAFHPNGSRLVAAGRHGWAGTLGPGLRLWNPTTGAAAGDFHPLGDNFGIPRVCFLDGGRTVLAFARGSRTTALLDARTGAARPGPSLPARAEALAVRGDGAVVAVGAADGTVTQWDAVAGTPVGLSMAQPAPVTALEYAPGGKLLAGVGADRAVRLWDTATGLPVGPPLLHVGDVLAVRFTPDGRELRTATAAGEVRRWPLAELPPDDPAALEVWVEAAGGRGADGPRLLDPAAWDERRAELRRRWPAGAAALDARRSGPVGGDAAWHDARAAEAEATGNAVAAVWHLDQLAAWRPDDWYAHARRADARLRAGSVDTDAEARRRADPAAWADWLAHRAAGR
ncbi:MAG TPA: serine/threonine-protein kinase [Urbifossiella sp.]|nr:serine/threonine-protein kinase [Urbifossiella sp.]